MDSRPLAAGLASGLLLLAVAATSGGAPVEGNVVENPSFETPAAPAGSYTVYPGGASFPGWQTTGGGAAIVSGTAQQDGFSFPAAHGDQWLDLSNETYSGSGGVRQSIPTVAGRTYTLYWAVGNVSGGDFGTQSTVGVSIDGSQVRTVTNSQQGTTTNWQRFTHSFTASSASTVIEFSNLDSAGDENNGLDDVSVGRCNRVKTGTGYAGLTGAMKSALDRLYDALDEAAACYRFNIGARSQQYQDNLRKRWHDIADKPAGDDRTSAQIKQQLKNAGFAQTPKGYKPANEAGLRVAKGGPAKKSRHTAGEAADLTVTFPTEKDLGKFQDAARQAGLCGPPAGDPVHVELPYRRKDRAHPGRKLFRCHFPEGPAPSG